MKTYTIPALPEHRDLIRKMCDVALRVAGLDNLGPAIEILSAVSGDGPEPLRLSQDQVDKVKKMADIALRVGGAANVEPVQDLLDLLNVKPDRPKASKPGQQRASKKKVAAKRVRKSKR